MYYASTMFAKFRHFLAERGGRARSADGRHDLEELHLAAAALMVEAARLDGRLDDDERRQIAAILRERFALDDETVRLLIEAAVGNGARPRTIRDHFTHEERVAMLEMLWEVAYADGELHDYEASLLRQVTGLLYVTDQESGAARKRALERLGI